MNPRKSKINRALLESKDNLPDDSVENPEEFAQKEIAEDDLDLSFETELQLNKFLATKAF